MLTRYDSRFRVYFKPCITDILDWDANIACPTWIPRVYTCPVCSWRRLLGRRTPSGSPRSCRAGRWPWTCPASARRSAPGSAATRGSGSRTTPATTSAIRVREILQEDTRDFSENPIWNDVWKSGPARRTQTAAARRWTAWGPAAWARRPRWPRSWSRRGRSRGCRRCPRCSRPGSSSRSAENESCSLHLPTCHLWAGPYMSVLAQHVLQLGHLVPVILVNEALGLHREVLQQDRITD